MKLKALWKAKAKEEEEEESTSSEESEDEEVDTDQKTNGKSVEEKEKKKSKWTNRERVLIFCARGSDYRTRHLMNDFKAMLPHAKSETKLDKKTALPAINEIAEMKNCTKVLYFETRKHKDVYLWMSNVDGGPSVKFLVHNIHTLDELKMTGNCLKSSRPVLSFSSNFDANPHLALIKQILTQTFATPNFHPRSQPFIDHVFSFSVTPDEKIWFRNFQIVDETLQLQEIGAVLYDNPDFESPNELRAAIKRKLSEKYTDKKLTHLGQKEKRRRIEETKREDVVGEVFDTNKEIEEPAALKLAKKIDGIKDKKKREKLKLKKRKEKAAELTAADE